MGRIQKITYLGICTALALGLAYLETLIPIHLGIPGIKIGLPNLVIFFVLYRLGWKEAFTVSLIRLLLVFLIFGNLIHFCYSLSGAVCSLVVMILMKKRRTWSSLTVSISGAVMHSVGQILIAMFFVGAPQVLYYLPVLILASFLTGGCIGIVSSVLISKVPAFEKMKKTS